MSKAGIAPLMLALLTAAAPQPSTPSIVVERQLAAYNAHDAHAFAATYAVDAQIFKPGQTAPYIEGRAAIEAGYAALFKAKPAIRVEVGARLTAGAFVSDHETVVGTDARALVVYEVRDGLIQRAWLFPATP